MIRDSGLLFLATLYKSLLAYLYTLWFSSRYFRCGSVRSAVYRAPRCLVLKPSRYSKHLARRFQNWEIEQVEIFAYSGFHKIASLLRSKCPEFNFGRDSRAEGEAKHSPRHQAVRWGAKQTRGIGKRRYKGTKNGRDGRRIGREKDENLGGLHF